MQDIDFDELDRAITSARPTRSTAASTSRGDSVPVSTSSSRPSSPTPAARRSSGRFMDVVHPSSDMRTSSVPERPATHNEHTEPVSPRPSEKSTTDWPDPLDFHGFKDDLDEKPDVPAEKTDDVPTPLESPFLNNTKVEKRPLGAFSDDIPPSVLPEVPEEKADETPEEKEEPKEELLLEAPDEELLEATNDEPEPVTEESQEDLTSSLVDDEPVGPTSITQQYKEQPSTTDQVTGAIFDTEAYHQALVHTPHKRSSAAIVIWIIVLILVGAGAGAAVYFFVLPML